MTEAGRPDQGSEIAREDVAAILEVRKELGSSYDVALVDSFAERIEQAVEQRVDARLDRERTSEKQRAGDKQRQFVLGIVSLGVGIPITAISAALVDVPGVALSWLGIAAVNAAHAAAVNGPARRAHRPGR